MRTLITAATIPYLTSGQQENPESAKMKIT